MEKMGIDQLLENARSRVDDHQTSEYAGKMVGTIGLDPATR